MQDCHFRSLEARSKFLDFVIPPVKYKLKDGSVEWLLGLFQVSSLVWVPTRGEDKEISPPPNTTDVAPPHMSYHRKFLPVGISVTHLITKSLEINTCMNCNIPRIRHILLSRWRFKR